MILSTRQKRVVHLVLTAMQHVPASAIKPCTCQDTPCVLKTIPLNSLYKNKENCQDPALIQHQQTWQESSQLVPWRMLSQEMLFLKPKIDLESVEPRRLRLPIMHPSIISMKMLLLFTPSLALQDLLKIGKLLWITCGNLKKRKLDQHQVHTNAFQISKVQMAPKSEI